MVILAWSLDDKALNAPTYQGFSFRQNRYSVSYCFHTSIHVIPRWASSVPLEHPDGGGHGRS